MKKYLSIFAHFDRDNVIDDYVILYLKALKQVSSEVIFVSDCNLPEVELRKLSEICIIKIATKHGEYDFGSWKRGLSAAKEKLNIDNYDEIVLANDSCYLLSPLTAIFTEMEKRNPVDFWGIAQSKQQGSEHLHSYFMVFSKKVFLSEIFNNFFENYVTKQDRSLVIKNCEIGLTKILSQNGFTKDSFIKKILPSDAIGRSVFTNLIPHGFPFVKAKLFRNGFVAVTKCKSITSKENYEAISKNLLKEIGSDKLLEAYHYSYFDIFFLHKFLFRVLLKHNVFSIKIFGLSLFKKKLT